MTWLADDSRAGAEVMLSLPRVAPADAGARSPRWLAACASRDAARPSEPRPGSLDVRRPRAVALCRRRSPRRRHPRRVAGRASASRPPTKPRSGWRGAARPRPSPTTPASPTSTRSSTPCWSTSAAQIAVMALSVAHEGAIARAATRLATTTGRCRSTLDAAGAAQRRRARRARLRPAAAPPARPASRRSDVADTGAGDRRAWRRTAASSCACRGPRRIRFPSRCGRSSIAAPPGRCGCATATPAPSSAPSTAGARRRPTDDGGPVALLLDRLRTRRPPAGAARARRAGAARSRRSRASAPTRSRRTCCPTWRSSFELLRTINTAQVQGTQISGNGPVLTPAPRRRADRRRRRAPGGEQPARLARTARRRRRQGAARGDRPGRGSPATPRRPCAPRATTARSSTSIAALQNLGRLMLRYHFAEEAEQIVQLMQPAPASRRRRARAARPRPGRRELRGARRRRRDASASRSRATGAWATRSCT